MASVNFTEQIQGNTGPALVYTVPAGMTFYCTSISLDYLPQTTVAPVNNAQIYVTSPLSLLLSPAAARTMQRLFPTPLVMLAGATINTNASGIPSDYYEITVNGYTK